MTLDELNVLMNSWPEGTVGWHSDGAALRELDRIGSAIGYGALAQFSQWLYETQCHKDQANAALLKRERFKLLGWDLPDNFEEVARKELPFGPEDLR